MLFLNNDDVAKLLTIDDCIEEIEAAYKEMGAGRAAQFPEEGRMDLSAPAPAAEVPPNAIGTPRFTWGAMAGVLPSQGIFALPMKFDIHYQAQQESGAITAEKYAISPGNFCGLIMLASTENAEPLAIMNDGVVQHMRVGATAAMAAKYLAKKDSRVVGVIGSGGMARTYTAAYCHLFPIEKVQVYSLTPAHREAFAQEMVQKLGIPVAVKTSAEAATEGADIVADCTDAVSAIFTTADWVQPGMHITTYGANRIGKEVVERADLVVRHFKGNQSVRVGDDQEEHERWRTRNPASIQFEEMPLLIDVVSGKLPGRTDDQQITCFYNVVGSGITFPAVGALIYRRAVEREIGRRIPTGWFLQDIRD